VCRQPSAAIGADAIPYCCALYDVLAGSLMSTSFALALVERGSSVSDFDENVPAQRVARTRMVDTVPKELKSFGSSTQTPATISQVRNEQVAGSSPAGIGIRLADEGEFRGRGSNSGPLIPGEMGSEAMLDVLNSLQKLVEVLKLQL
jgi:hypothetical protein